jgi:quercetin dioxygenase-like cupin family protein
MNWLNSPMRALPCPAEPASWMKFSNTHELNMTRMKKFKITAMAMLVTAAALAPLGAQAQQNGVTRTDLQRHDISAPGREAIQVRVDLAPGVAFGKHTHHGEEVIYVLEGTLEYQIEDKPPVTLKAGDVLFVPAGTVHSARNPGSVTGSELATYIVEKGKPLVTLVK